MTDTRPPLYLTASEAANWLSLHSEDIGREIFVVESPVKGCPPEIVKAWEGFGRWEQGMAGKWPTHTLFSTDILERPPAWAVVTGKRVYLTLCGEEATYRLWGPMQRRANPLVMDFLKDDGRVPATLVGWSR